MKTSLLVFLLLISGCSSAALFDIANYQREEPQLSELDSMDCLGGHGSTIYIPRDIFISEAHFLDTLDPFTGLYTFSYVAIEDTNGCGEVIRRDIVIDGNLFSVSRVDLDAFVSDYDLFCDSCLIRLHQSGNSPVFMYDVSEDREMIFDVSSQTFSYVAES